MNNTVLKILWPIAQILIIGVMGLFFGYITGVVFDYFMGTHATPIFTLIGLVGVYTVPQKPVESELVSIENLYFGIWYIIIYPFTALLLAVPANWLFPGAEGDLMTMIGYSGSFYALVFFGSASSGLVKLFIHPAMMILRRFIFEK